MGRRCVACFDRLDEHRISWRNYFTDLPGSVVIPSIVEKLGAFGRWGEPRASADRGHECFSTGQPGAADRDDEMASPFHALGHSGQRVGAPTAASRRPELAYALARIRARSTLALQFSEQQAGPAIPLSPIQSRPDFGLAAGSDRQRTEGIPSSRGVFARYGRSADAAAAYPAPSLLVRRTCR